jgi:hypothetical protein
MTQAEDNMSLRSGTKYVASTDTQQIHDDVDKCLTFKDSKVQLQLRL